MSAASPNQQVNAQEPSMEEILASIRRIIADDQAPKPVEAAPAPLLPENDDVLDLAEVAEPVHRPQPILPEIDFGDEHVDFAEPEPEPVPSFAQMRAEVEEKVVERLVSKETDDSVGQAFQRLSHTILTQNARTLEDLVKDMLRPMLKAWLDDNLPMMVERLVRTEIERVVRGR